MTRTARIILAGTPLIHAQGSRAGNPIEFRIPVPCRVHLTFEVAKIRLVYEAEVSADGEVRIMLLERSGRPDPAAFGLSAIEGELLDGLARLIARDMLRQRVA